MSDHPTAEDGPPPHPRALRVRCPHCHNPIELVDDAPLTDIECPSCGSHFSLLSAQSTTTYHPEGAKRIAHFELIEQVGIGHIGSVWKARDTQLDRTVAVKIPRKGALEAAEAEQFLREARAAAQIRHPNIVSVHEVGRDDDSVYIVSDFIEGANLHEWLTGQRLTPREAAELCVKIADALHEAHEAGVVHRDLKPGNIMLDTAGEPYIADFGLAKREAGEITMTMDGRILGTPAYMSPEQARGKAHEADRRSDVYSLGVILYELLTGELPFRGETRMLIVQILRDEPTSPRKLNSRIPRDLETICLKCLEKDPDRRYPTARELADELRRYLNGKTIQARPITRTARTWRWAKGNPVVAALSAAVLLALAIGTGVSTYFAIAANRRAREADENAILAARQTVEAISQKDRADREKLAAFTLAHYSLQEALAPHLQAPLEDAIGHSRAIESLAQALVDEGDEHVSDADVLSFKVRRLLLECEQATLEFRIVEANLAFDEAMHLTGLVPMVPPQGVAVKQNLTEYRKYSADKELRLARDAFDQAKRARDACHEELEARLEHAMAEVDRIPRFVFSKAASPYSFVQEDLASAAARKREIAKEYLRDLSSADLLMVDALEHYCSAAMKHEHAMPAMDSPEASLLPELQHAESEARYAVLQAEKLFNSAPAHIAAPDFHRVRAVELLIRSRLRRLRSVSRRKTTNRPAERNEHVNLALAAIEELKQAIAGYRGQFDAHEIIDPALPRYSGDLSQLGLLMVQALEVAGGEADDAQGVTATARSVVQESVEVAQVLYDAGNEYVSVADLHRARAMEKVTELALLDVDVRVFDVSPLRPAGSIHDEMMLAANLDAKACLESMTSAQAAISDARSAIDAYRKEFMADLVEDKAMPAYFRDLITARMMLLRSHVQYYDLVYAACVAQAASRQ